MPETKQNGSSGTSDHNTIYIREKTALPTNSRVKSETFVPGWRVVTNFNRSTLTTSIENATWYFFYLAGEMNVTVFGGNRPETIRRAVRMILLKQTKQEFNSLEVTEVAPKRILGLPFLKVTAHSRHIQERISLLCAAASGIGDGAGPAR
jgi:hypothetical protein